MDLQTGKLYWNTTFPNPPSYPCLEKDIICYVLIIGAGSLGAQSAYYLCDSDLSVVVVDKRKIGHGSNLTNTALIQYLGDKMFFELVNTFGEEYTVKHMRLCEEAINDIEFVNQKLPFHSDFMRRDSLYFASYEEEKKSFITYKSMVLKRIGYQKNKLDRNIHLKNVLPFIHMKMVK